MAKTEDSKTKVRPLKSKPNMDSKKSKKLNELQKMIDSGKYKVSSSNIAKAYLHKSNVEFNTFSYENVESKDEQKVKKTLKILK